MKHLTRSSLVRNLFPVFVSVFALLFGVQQASALLGTTNLGTTNLQMQLGNLTGATADTNNHNHYLIQRPVETIDYSDVNGQPNWASWDYTSDDSGSSGRGNFSVDTSLPPNFKQIPTSTYGTINGQSYDRGHMCPSADRTVTVATNDMVFIMSNIIPQASSMNEGVWATIENYCRDTLAAAGNELLIMCGPYNFSAGTADSGLVTLSSNNWKIIVVVPLGDGTALSRITNSDPNSIRVIALEIPNFDGTTSTGWQSLYGTSVKKIQADTGYNFFSALPNNLAWVLRSKVDGQTSAAPGSITFSPSSGAVSSSVTITGTALDTVTNVTFNGTIASYNIDSPTQITATVPAGATSGSITVMGLGGNATSASSFTVAGANPDLTISKTHTGNFVQGDTGDTYTIIVTNIGGSASSGTVTVTDTLPSGLTATGITGTGWTPNLGTLTCTRSDALAAGSTYPPITLTVNVAGNAPASVTNSVTVSGGGESITSNNTATDPTTIITASAPTVTTTAATGVGTTTATLNGTVNPNGLSTWAQFQYGLTTSYGLTNVVSGPLIGASAQPVSASLIGLTAGMTYHFRVSATNSLGTANGSDLTFTTTALVPDLAITKSHSGNFTQGDTGDTYTIIVTNVGNAASSGTVTVTDTLPTGLTATAINGTGWTTDLPSLTATRSDALAAGAAYQAITITVSVATNAVSSVTNTATVSGGGESVTSNDTASDPTTINVAAGGLPYSGVLAGWDVSLQSSFGTSPLTASTNAPNLTVGGLTRGSGVTTSGSGAARGWGGTGFTSGNEAAAITANQFATFSITANTGYKVSLTNISRLDYRRSSTGASSGELQYQVGSGAFVDITALSYSSTASSGASLGPIDLSGITALQNISAGTTVTFRIVNWGASGSGGTWYIFDMAVSTADDLEVQGTVSSVSSSSTPDLTISKSHTGNFTQGDTGDTYTIVVTNIGTAASSGTVTVTDTLPAGLTATGITGTGWTPNLGTLTCTRSDALTVGATYPPITVTVSVATNAASSVVNTATVSGGGDASSGNNSVNDSTTINAASAPTATTSAATSVGTTTATLNGTVNPNGQPATVQFQYGLTTAYGSIATVAGPLTGSTGQAVSANLTGLTPGATYHFLVNATNVIGSANGSDLVFTTAAPDLAITKTHVGNFTQGDTGDTYTITVTNIGAAASSGTVTVTDTLPSGLTATGISGTGWTPNLGTLTCTRSDSLAAGAGYPPITVTVTVATNAATSVTNTATVSGGGDANASNNTATDPTTIIALAPIQSWRLQYFGTTNNSEASADTAVSSSDGMPNLLKYALSLNPLVPAANPVVGDIGTGYLRLTLPKNPAATDISFYVEVATTVTGPWSTNGTTVDINTSTQLQVHYSTPVNSSTEAFIRLRVSRP